MHESKNKTPTRGVWQGVDASHIATTMWAAPVTGAPAHEHRALHQLLGKPASPAPRRDAKVLDVGDMSVVFAHVDPLWLRFSTPELEAAFQKDAFHSASAMHHWQSLCMLMLLLAQWVLHLARTGINPTTSFWRSAPNQVLYRICIILAYMSGRALLYLSVPAQRGDVLVRQVFILINMVPRLFMISQWLLSLRRHGWPAYRAATLNEYHHTPLDCPAGAVMVLTVFFLPIMVQLHFCGPLTRIMMLLTVMVSLMTPHAALPDDDSAISLLTVHLVASVAAHFLELIARVAYMRQAKLLVHMRQQMAADSKLNHLLKNKCAEARAEIEALQVRHGKGVSARTILLTSRTPSHRHRAAHTPALLALAPSSAHRILTPTQPHPLTILRTWPIALNWWRGWLRSTL